MSEHNSSFLAYEQKLFSAQPELAVIGVFLPNRQRRMLTAFACLVHELELTAFTIREPQVAISKLQWWTEELARAVTGQAQHPVTRALFEIEPVRAQSVLMWQALLEGASTQLDSRSPPDLPIQLQQMGHFYAPVANLEMALLTDATGLAVNRFKGGIGANAAIRVMCITQLLRHLNQWFAARAVVQTSPLPLNLLARYHRTIADLAEPPSLWREVLNDYLKELASAIERDLPNAYGLSMPRRVQARLALVEIRRWRNATLPERLIGVKNCRVSLGCVWYAWRESRAALAR